MERMAQRILGQGDLMGLVEKVARVQQEISEEELKKIVEIQLRRLSKRLEQQKIALKLSDSAKALLAREGYDPVYGARPLARVIQTDVRDPLTDQILFGELEHGGTVTINVDDGALTFEYAAKQQ